MPVSIPHYSWMDLVAAIRTPSCLWISWFAASAAFRSSARSGLAATAPSHAWSPRWSCPRCSRQAVSCSRWIQVLRAGLALVVLRVGKHHRLALHVVLDLLLGKDVIFPFLDGADAPVLVHPRAVAALPLTIIVLFLTLRVGIVLRFALTLGLLLPRLPRHELHVALVGVHLQ